MPLASPQLSAQSQAPLAHRLSASLHSRIPRAVPLANHRSLGRGDRPLVNPRSWDREGRPLDRHLNQPQRSDSRRNQPRRLDRLHSQPQHSDRHRPLAQSPAPLALQHSGSRRSQLLKAAPLVRPVSLARTRILLAPRRIRTITRVPLRLRAIAIMHPQRIIPLAHPVADLRTTRTRAHLEIPTTNRPTTLGSVHSGNLHREIRPLVSSSSNRMLRQHQMPLLPPTKHQPRMRTPLVSHHSRNQMVSHHRTTSKRIIHLASHRNPILSVNPLQHRQVQIPLPRPSLRLRSQRPGHLLVIHTLRTAADSTRRLKATAPRAWMADCPCSVASQLHTRITCQASETLMGHGGGSGSRMAHRDIRRIRSSPLNNMMTSPRLSGWHSPKRASLRAV